MNSHSISSSLEQFDIFLRVSLQTDSIQFCTAIVLSFSFNNFPSLLLDSSDQDILGRSSATDEEKQRIARDLNYSTIFSRRFCTVFKIPQ